MISTKYTVGFTEGTQYPVFKLAKFDIKKAGDVYVTPLPSFLGDVGFHWSLHASGVSHFRTTKPKMSVNVDLEKFAKPSRSELESFLNKIIQLPKKGSPALISIINKIKFRNSIVSQRRIILDLNKIFDYLTVVYMEDAGDVVETLKILRRQGHLTAGDLVMIHSLENGQISLYDYEENIPSATSGFMKVMNKVEGSIITIDSNEIDNLIQSSLFKPIMSPMFEIMDKLEGHIKEPDNFYFPDFSKFVPSRFLKVNLP